MKIVKQQFTTHGIYVFLHILIVSVTLFFSLEASSQGVGINISGAAPDPSAILDISSTDKGTLHSRMTTAQRDAINSPANSLIIFNTTTNCLQIYIAGQWMNIQCACDPPIAPTAANATNVDFESFDANWNSSNGATTYYIDVDDNSDFSSPLGGYNNLNVGLVTTYTVSGLARGTTYYYRVRAENSCGISGNSNTITTTTSTCPTWSDAFTTDNWTDVGNQNFVRVNTTNNNIEFSTMRRVTTTASCFDLQSILGAGNFADQNAWVLRFQLQWSTITTDVHNSILYVGLFSEDCSFGTFAAQDGVYMTVVPKDSQWGARSCDGGNCFAGTGASSGSPTTATNYFVELTRDSQTSATINISNTGYGVTPFLTHNITINATLENLRYIKVSNYDDQNSLSGGPGIGTIDDVQFCNGTTNW